MIEPMAEAVNLYYTTYCADCFSLQAQFAPLLSTRELSPVAVSFPCTLPQTPATVIDQKAATWLSGLLGGSFPFPPGCSKFSLGYSLVFVFPFAKGASLVRLFEPQPTFPAAYVAGGKPGAGRSRAGDGIGGLGPARGQPQPLGGQRHVSGPKPKRKESIVGPLE